MNILPAPPVSEDFQGINPLPTDPTYGWFFETFHWNRLSLIADPLGANNTVLSCTVQPGDVVNGGERCEFSYQPADPVSYERHFDWEFMIPANYNDPQPGEWQHMGQFHDQPEDGDWSNYPSNSPPISCDYEYSVVSTLPQAITAFWDLNFPGWTSMVVNDRISTMSVSVGVTAPKEIIMAVPFTKGTWQKIGLDIRWSHDAEGGWVKAYHDDVLLGQHNGQNMHNDYFHYFKLGIYRSPVAFSNTVYYKNVNII